jgi:DnaJ like chaperone protein
VTIWRKLGPPGWASIGEPIGSLASAVASFVADRASGLFAADRQLVFTTGLVALAAKMAKADGVVTRDEMRAFRQVVTVDGPDAARIERLFTLAKETSAGFEVYAAQIAEHFRLEPALLEDVLDGLFHIAKADGAVHEAELDYLREVGRIFGFSGRDYARIEARHVHLADDPYLVLGADRAMDDEALRRCWRRLAAECHPDRQVALGLPPEAIAIATQRLAAINAAWDRIAAERGLR